ncbi:MAG TPA: hypothetical protein VJU81_19445 [Methylomirabilota bacterium]|nr:hypothetical protein [Methylomirabilota bacterium]
MGGVIVALPLTSGPVALFLVLEQGPAFAAGASLGSMAGALAQGVFCLGYSALAARGWPLAFAGGTAAFAVIGLVLQRLALPLIPLSLVVAVGLAAAMVAMPRGQEARRLAPPPAWDIPARMVVATTLVLALTAAAAALGPRLSGLLATFPVYAGILAVFGHHHDGVGPATRALRGLLAGLFGFAAFFAVIAALIERVGTAPAFAAALVVTMVLQALALALVREAPAPG